MLSACTMEDRMQEAVRNVKLYRTTAGSFVEEDGQYYRIDGLSWDGLLGA